MALKKEGVKVSCCNISCGYYNPHTDYEFTSLDDLNKCWSLVSHILSLPDTYPHEAKEEKSYLGYYGEYWKNYSKKTLVMPPVLKSKKDNGRRLIIT
ncbi:MAG: hypothetical protein MJ224_01380 [archaeon]|nr:hypothetical protein [archaeon]